MNERRSRLEGKVAIVTGAGSRSEGIGNGKATATLFAREGAKVVLVDIEIERANETLADIEAEGGIASAFAADVCSDEECKALVDFAVSEYGRLDILDNNVGNSHRERVTEIALDAWDKIMTLNLKSMVLTSRHAIPRMVETGGGSIINISSISGIRSGKDPAYTASKAGVIGLTVSMAGDHGREGIRVNAIAPGFILTDFNRDYFDSGAGDDTIAKIPQRRVGVPSDLDGTLLLLASDASSYMTGSVVVIDGGHLNSSL